MTAVARASLDAVEAVLDALRAEGLATEPLDGEWLAAHDEAAVAGVARTFERDGEWMLEDVWVDPARRSAGIGAALVHAAKNAHSPLWLICDEDMVDYYARLGFVSEDALPEGLAKVNARKGYWQPPDHVHVAMRTRR